MKLKSAKERKLRARLLELYPNETNEFIQAEFEKHWAIIQVKESITLLEHLDAYLPTHQPVYLRISA